MIGESSSAVDAAHRIPALRPDVAILDGRLPDGRPFSAVSPMGYVPAIETRGGFVLTEGPAVLTYIAELAPEGSLSFTGW